MQVTFVGAGKMATAIACGMIDHGVCSTDGITASDLFSESRDAFTKATGCLCFESNEEAVAGADVVVLAVKPQEAGKVLPPLREVLHGKLLISIAAGLKLERLQEWSGVARVIRVMPNTPAMVTMGASVYACTADATDADRKLADDVFNAIGYACEMPEDKLDAVTALSGSGPAYLFAYVESMVAGAEKLGLDGQLAQRLCVQTIAGAAEMLKRNLGTPEELRKAVTSKGGTTAAGLASLADDDFHGTLIRCLEAAKNRSVELGK